MEDVPGARRDDRPTVNCPNCGAPMKGFKCEYCGTPAIPILELGGEPVMMKFSYRGEEFTFNVVVDRFDVDYDYHMNSYSTIYADSFCYKPTCSAYPEIRLRFEGKPQLFELPGFEGEKFYVARRKADDLGAGI